MTKQQVFEAASEAVKIYFNYNVSAEEAIAKAKEMILNEKVEKVEKAS